MKIEQDWNNDDQTAWRLVSFHPDLAFCVKEYVMQSHDSKIDVEMSFSTTASSTLLMATGILHSGVGFMIPKLREPLLRILSEGTTEVVDIQRYEKQRHTSDDKSGQESSRHTACNIT